MSLIKELKKAAKGVEKGVRGVRDGAVEILGGTPKKEKQRLEKQRQTSEAQRKAAEQALEQLREQVSRQSQSASEAKKVASPTPSPVEQVKTEKADSEPQLSGAAGSDVVTIHDTVSSSAQAEASSEPTPNAPVTNADHLTSTEAKPASGSAPTSESERDAPIWKHEPEIHQALERFESLCIYGKTNEAGSDASCADGISTIHNAIAALQQTQQQCQPQLYGLTTDTFKACTDTPLDKTKCHEAFRSLHVFVDALADETRTDVVGESEHTES